MVGGTLRVAALIYPFPTLPLVYELRRIRSRPAGSTCFHKLMVIERAPDEVSVGEPDYVLHLYISGTTPSSARAVYHLRDSCERYLPGRYDVQIIDLYQQPKVAQAAHITAAAAPTLVGHWQGKTHRLNGDLTHRQWALRLLGIAPAPNDPYVHV